jgi:sulfur-oxidizing protein SoxZ
MAEAASKPRIKLPETVAAGEIIEVKALISHVMETGNRRDADGKTIPRNIINSFTAAYAGALVFKAEFGSGISANPYLSFYMRVPRPGELELTWTDDQGVRTVERTPVNVS